MPRGTSEATKARIIGALGEMMAERPLEKIEVSELCRRAGVSRTAFYRHYRGIYDVPTRLWDECIGATVGQVGPECSFREGNRRFFNLILGYREFFSAAFKADGLDSTFRSTERHALRMHLENFARQGGGRSLSDVEMLELRFYNAGAAAMSREWAISGMRITPDEMAACFTRLAPAFLVETLEGGYTLGTR